MNTLTDLPAPAKLNLFLHVLGRRADGYHLLQSLFLPIDWADTLHLERRADGRLQRHDLGPALPADDLCLRAARALQQASGTAWGVDISIDKQVPWGAGMGGGSSDAATVLRGLNVLWDLHWPRERLLALGATLGADVPFFLGAGPAWVEGIGEQLTPVAWPSQRFAVVKPPVALPTAQIFSSPLLTRDTRPATVAGLLADAADLSKLMAAQATGGAWKNDLQPAAEAICPEVSEAISWLTRHFGHGRMTGSGSAAFAGIDNGTGAPSLATMPEGPDPFAELPEGWVGRLCRSLERHPLEDLAG
ncbi:4-(cytidine 5'-diphospho)-2-C-methyl-D-erythritol kinase [Ideonella alba]|uniref:4-diphosphocytidyl-2-C-methyl-D-erythritol kinase n=1 Tax=Ideonella alba TaxID=2824118 RepID=A0A941BLG9_9BURK|nr:4-(cytidine 5'-diphospho)-2-C-methyl-D-erythritol kinase [Ideonella alba]MBQ0931189.1 4-(cytidine 5'-diphospho)-2-C-methyl-D-erythritol kinase [Ideonella alba]